MFVEIFTRKFKTLGDVSLSSIRVGSEHASIDESRGAQTALCSHNLDRRSVHLLLLTEISKYCPIPLVSDLEKAMGLLISLSHSHGGIIIKEWPCPHHSCALGMQSDFSSK